MRQVKIWYDDDSATYSAEIRDDNGLVETRTFLFTPNLFS